MARIQQSVELKVPAHVAYNQLTQFEDYPRFMDEVESARQVDDTHVHWTTKTGSQSRDWASEIIEQQPDHCIAWRNVEGPVTTGRMDVEALGNDSSRVTFTMEAEGGSGGASQGAADAESAMAQQVEANLQRLKQMIEAGGETGAWRGEVHDGQVTMRDRDAGQDSQDSQGGRSTQSENSLSQGQGQSQGGDAGSEGFNVAEEVSTDQQSDAARQVGHLAGTSAEGYGDVRTAEAMKEAMQSGQQSDGQSTLDQSMERAVRKSD
jgi:hypothetical protein